MTFKTYEINIDLVNDPSTASTIHFSTNDRNAAKLLLTITNKGAELDLSQAKSVRISFKKPDGTSVFQNDCLPINTLKGKYQIVLNTQTLAVEGYVYAQVHIEEEDRTIDTQKFFFVVNESLSSDESVESTNQFGFMQKYVEASEKLEGVNVDALIASKETAEKALVEVNNNKDQIGILSGNQGDVSKLDTNAKKVVDAINELKATGGGVKQVNGVSPDPSGNITIPIIKGDKGDMGSVALVDGTLAAIVDTTDNIFNPYKVLLGNLDNTTGVVSDSTSEYTTDFLLAYPDKYIASNNGAKIAFYDANKVYISGYANLNYNSSRKFPVTAKYYKLGMTLANYNNMCIKVSSAAFTSAITYTEYKLTMDSFKLKNVNITNEAVDKIVSDINAGKQLSIPDTNWTNVLKNGQLNSGTPSWLGNNLTVGVNGFSFNTTYAYPTVYTPYIYNFLANTYALYYDLNLLNTSNFTGCKIGVQIKTSSATIVDYVQFNDLIVGNNKGVILFAIPTDVAACNVNINVRQFSNVPNGANNIGNFTLNHFMIVPLLGHLKEMTTAQLKEGIGNRAYAEGNLNNYLNTRYADKSIRASYADNMSSGWNGKKFVSFGDSLTAQAKWQQYVIDKLGFFSHVNCGIGGTAVSVRDNNGVSYNTDSFFQDTRINAIPTDADLITVMGGFNDFNQFATIGGSMPTLDSATFKGALSLTIEKILNKAGMNPNVKIVLMTEPYGYTDPAPSRANITLKQIVDAIKEVGQFYGLPVIDLYGNCGWNYVNRNIFLADSVHPNDVGGKRMAEVITPQLRRIEPI